MNRRDRVMTLRELTEAEIARSAFEVGDRRQKRDLSWPGRHWSHQREEEKNRLNLER